MMFYCDLVCVYEYKRVVFKLDSGCVEDVKD